MQKRTRGAVMVAVVVGSLFTVMSVANAHQCTEKPGKKKKAPATEECHETPVYEDWRSNYVPLFDLTERDDEQRYDAQRWRDECSDDGEERQQCAWLYGGSSAQEYPSDVNGPRPNELHAGYAANHCFLAEAAHDCDNHEDSEFGTHDPHGGAIYVDVCLAENPDSRRCDDGTTDTQAGVTIVDHLTCPAGCADEYHIVRPADTAYTTEQMEDSVTATEVIASDPVSHLCGYPGHTSCPE